MSINLNLNSSSATYNASYLFNAWTRYVKKEKAGYFTISNKLEEYLPYIKSPALNLYTFYAIHARNEQGYSYYSNATLSEILQVSPKTITNWNATLQDLGLIYRDKRNNSSWLTYLLPLSDFAINISNKNNLGDLKELLHHLGYKESNTVHLYINTVKLATPKSIKYKYTIYQKKIKDNKKTLITRNIFLRDNDKTDSLQLPNNINEFTWQEKEGKTIIIWTPSKNKKENNTKQNRLSIVKQLDSPKNVELFKKKYSAIEDKLQIDDNSNSDNTIADPFNS